MGGSPLATTATSVVSRKSVSLIEKIYQYNGAVMSVYTTVILINLWQSVLALQSRFISCVLSFGFANLLSLLAHEFIGFCVPLITISQPAISVLSNLILIVYLSVLFLGSVISSEYGNASIHSIKLIAVLGL